MKWRWWRVIVVACLLSTVRMGVAAESRLRLATTTSTENSGLLSYLIPPFEARFKVRVDIIAVGTGKALTLGRNGDVDVMLVHAPGAEAAFMEAEFGVEHRRVMRNAFLLLGPRDNPARVQHHTSAKKAWRQLATSQVTFVSRGDASGTHRKEMMLWKQAGVTPTDQAGYIEVGQGMGATLQIASQKQAYTLSDQGTYLAYRQQLDLAVVHTGDSLYDNPYSIMAVNPKRHPHVKYNLAMALVRWLTSPEGQQRIGSYRRDGEVLFSPIANSKKP